MSYVLKSMNTADYQRIETDADGLIPEINNLNFNLEQGHEVFWVIDQENNSYLVEIPSIVMDGKLQQEYLFYNGSPHKLTVEGMFSSKVCLANPSPENLTQIESELTKAFHFHGRHAKLQLQNTNHSDNQFVPVFIR